MTYITLMQIQEWDIEKLSPNPLNPRGAVTFQDEGISELAESIRMHGLIQPIMATPKGIIVAGHRRHAACQMIAMEKVIVILKDIDEAEQIELMLVENCQRHNLNPMQVASGYKALHDRGISIRDIATRVQCHYASVRKHLDLLKLPEELHQFFASRQMPIGYVEPLSELKSKGKQLEFAKRAKERNWSVNELNAAVKRGTLEKASPERKDRTKKDLMQSTLDSALDLIYLVRQDLAAFTEFHSLTEVLGHAETRLAEEGSRIITRTR
jgi:ParB family transcriptional regulator, chromosome partitioning protein